MSKRYKMLTNKFARRILGPSAAYSLLACVTVIGFASAACSDGGDVSDEGVAQNVQLELKQVPAKAGTMRWREVGGIRVMPPGTPAAKAHIDSAEDSEKAAAEDKSVSAVVTDDLVTGTRYILESTSEFEQAKSLVKLSLAQDPDLATQFEKDEEEPLVAKGWSDDTGNNNGNDARINRSTWSNSIYRRFGRLGTGCTATMVRQTSNGTFAMTAAHCVHDTSGNPIFTNFEPADGNTASTGLWDVTSITRYQNWVDNSCGSQSGSLSNCRQWDIALLWLTPRSGTTYLGGITYGSRNQSTIEDNTTKYHRGYPACGGTGAPSGCTGNRLWGDGAHGVAGFSHSDRLFRHSSDINGGHSGGPMYMGSSLGSTNVLYAVHTSETCAGNCNGNGNQPNVNRARRIDNNWYDIIHDIIHN